MAKNSFIEKEDQILQRQYGDTSAQINASFQIHLVVLFVGLRLPVSSQCSVKLLNAVENCVFGVHLQFIQIS